jgi:predicted O-methyltransferase YrrM
VGIILSLNQMLVDMIFKRFENGQKPKYVTIFGAGQNGLLLNKYLKNSDVTVNFFCDNNSKKHGTAINGVLCISFEELRLYKDDVVIFVSPYKSDEIVAELEKCGFPHIIASDFLKLLRFVPQTNNDNVYNLFPYIGHFYSLYPDIDEIIEKSETVFDPKREVKDIDFHEENQISILNQMIELYSSIPEWVDISIELGTTSLRHRYENPNLSAADAIGLHCMLRILKPKKMIEVGSGYTSAVTLDTNEFYLDNQIQLTFIEPYPNILKSILKETDKINLIEKGLQDVPLEVFEQLESGDVLFIDSTHVSKIDSDVNYLFFEILPRLKKGVYIHIHDIFYPFEYPKQWIIDGMIWNELYLLRAFLQNNASYSIVYFQNMMEQKYMNIFLGKWPLNVPIHGGSIWLEKGN